MSYENRLWCAPIVFGIPGEKEYVLAFIRQWIFEIGIVAGFWIRADAFALNGIGQV